MNDNCVWNFFNHTTNLFNESWNCSNHGLVVILTKYFFAVIYRPFKVHFLDEGTHASLWVMFSLYILPLPFHTLSWARNWCAQCQLQWSWTVQCADPGDNPESCFCPRKSTTELERSVLNCCSVSTTILSYISLKYGMAQGGWTMAKSWSICMWRFCAFYKIHSSKVSYLWSWL